MYSGDLSISISTALGSRPKLSLKATTSDDPSMISDPAETHISLICACKSIHRALFVKCTIPCLRTGPSHLHYWSWLYWHYPRRIKQRQRDNKRLVGNSFKVAPQRSIQAVPKLSQLQKIRVRKGPVVFPSSQPSTWHADLFHSIGRNSGGPTIPPMRSAYCQIVLPIQVRSFYDVISFNFPHGR